MTISRRLSGSTSALLDVSSSQKSVTRGLEGPLTAAWSAYLRLF
jgi:hypothetical protein